MTQETAKTAADTIVSKDLSTDQSTEKTPVVPNDQTKKLIVANDAGGENATEMSPTITFGGNPGSRRIRVEGLTEDAAVGIGYNPDHAPTSSKSAASEYLAEDLREEIAALRANVPNDPMPQLKSSTALTAIRVGGTFVSAAWLAAWTVYGASMVQSGAPYTGTDIAAMVAGAFTPVAVLWMALGQWMRGAEVRMYATAMRREMQNLIFPSDERAAHLNKDIERLMQQAAEMALASKATLKSVHRARQGLRSEMREFATLTKKAEVHIQSLTESLQNRSSSLLGLTDEIEQRVSTIDEKSRAGAEAWDQATLAILNKAGEIESAMGKGTTKIFEAPERAQVQAKAKVLMEQKRVQVSVPAK